MGHEEKYLLIGNVVARHRKPIARCSMSVPIPPPATAPISPPKEGEKDRHRLSGPLSGQGYAPPYDQPRQPILPAIIVAAQPAIVVVATHSLVIAHNAAFDRRFLERFCDVFSTKPWACSFSQIDWAAEGFEGAKLAYLAQTAGFFYDRHRAMHDCLATIELLAMRLPRSGVTGLSRLLDGARTVAWRIWAENSPFDLKDVLKARGYRWNGDPGPQPRAWYIDVPEAQREAELRFLRTEIYRYEADPPVRRIDAYDRFSDRI